MTLASTMAAAICDNPRTESLPLTGSVYRFWLGRSEYVVRFAHNGTAIALATCDGLVIPDDRRLGQSAYATIMAALA